MVWQVALAVEVPVIGIGGIMTADDALEFLLAGADAVQIGTANFVNPNTAAEIIDGLELYLDCHGFDSISEIVGAVRV